jgi:transcriptional regulator GlxA family with amidase domain
MDLNGEVVKHEWFVPVRDAHVGRALALLHETPERAWTVDELAQRAALWRSALAERFTALVAKGRAHRNQRRSRCDSGCLTISPP